MSELNLIVRTADKTRKAEITIESTNKIADVLQGAIDNWSLPKDNDYTIVNTTSGKTLTPQDTIGSAGITNGDTLEIQPVLVAG